MIIESTCLVIPENFWLYIGIFVIGIIFDRFYLVITNRYGD